MVRHRLVSEIVDAYEQRRRTARLNQRRNARRSVRAAATVSRRMSIEVSNESGMDVSEDELISVARFVIAQMNVNPAAELSMVLLDTAAMADLHMRWMDLPGPTDVMSFPDGRAGARRRAPTRPSPARRCSATSCCARSSPPSRPTTAGHSLGHELALLTVHGVLHLLGYDHAEPDEEKEMFALQRRLLEEWVRRPGRRPTARTRQTEKDRRLLDKSSLFDDYPELDEQ